MDTLDDRDQPVAEQPPSDWPTLWAAIDTIPGWLTEAQARVLRTAVQDLPRGATVVEIGAHRGRSTTVLASARPDLRVVAIDPFIRTRLLPGAIVEDELRANLERLGVTERVELLVSTSRKARTSWSEPIDLLWIDGKHDVVSLLQDLRWRRFLPAGGPVYVHDAFSSIGVTLGLIINQTSGRRALRFRRRTGSLAHFTFEASGSAARRHFAAQLGWWLRNILVKVLLRLRLSAVARWVFGHTGAADPF